MKSCKLDDLKAGQIVATICSDGSAGECIKFREDDRKSYERFLNIGGQAFILFEPPRFYQVSADAVDELARKLDGFSKSDLIEVYGDLGLLAEAVVRSVK